MSAGGDYDTRRVVILVIDACGVGALPDAGDYGDEGANTLAHVAEAVGGLRLPTLERMGLGTILVLPGVAPAAHPAIHGRLHALGPGKDSSAGHRELMGVVAAQAPPTYPDGFPPALVARLSAAMGHEVICNLPYDGISAVEDFAAEHLSSGALILYTSADSVLQLAAHVDRVPAADLYAACRVARAALGRDHPVGRVIARPFAGEPGAWTRTDGRRDFALAPPQRSYLDELVDAQVPVHGVGKISDLFAGAGITDSHPAPTNVEGLEITSTLSETLGHGLIFTNLIETDQLHGHRKDTEGFHRALQAIDAALAGWLARQGAGDLLIVTADHGVDPASRGTDHTREYVPLLAVPGRQLTRHPGDPLGSGLSRRHDGPLADVGATALRWLTGREADGLPGRAFAG